ncbi:MAG TPA: response regulator transcription factor [Anaerolineales bacterium]|nr:response regulator transcription factor [Anaerolineales bacterium]
MPEIRVLLVDDHPIVRAGIRNILDPAPGITVVGEASSGSEALQMIKDQKPDVVLLDMKLPDMSGIEVIKQIYENKSASRVLGLSSYDDRQYISQLLNYGASGYLLKEEVPEYIIEAVRGVAHGEAGWVSRKVAALLSEILLKEKEGGSELTSRELEVLRLVVEGKTNDQIGMDLGISVKTVENHLHAIFRKMGVISRVEAAVMAVRESLVR